jgi:hypothetical protein
VAVLGMVSMLSSQGQAPNTKLWLSCALGCAASAACFAIVAWRAEVDTAVAWPIATLADATAVLVGYRSVGEGTAGALPRQTRPRVSRPSFGGRAGCRAESPLWRPPPWR